MARILGAPKGVFKQAKRRKNARGPKTARTTILTIFGFLAACLWLGSTTNVPEVTRASGELVPEGGYRQVQSTEGGLVLTVHVSEGTLVRKGMPLAVLGSAELDEASSSVSEDLRSVQVELANLRELLKTLKTHEQPSPTAVSDLEVRGFDFAAAQLSIMIAEHGSQRVVASNLREVLELHREAYVLAEKRLGSQQRQQEQRGKLHSKGLLSQLNFDAEKDAVDQLEASKLDLGIRIVETQRELTAAETTIERDVLRRRAILVDDIFRLEQELEALNARAKTLVDRSAALTVRAPETGYIHQVAYPNPGEVIAPGETIFELLPIHSKLIAEIEFDPIDIGHIDLGDRVTLKLETFDVRRYGQVSGTIQSISPNSISDPETSRQFFRAKVVLDSDAIGLGKWSQKLRAGMVTTAEIVTSERTAIAYLAKPISRSIGNAFGER